MFDWVSFQSKNHRIKQPPARYQQKVTSRGFSEIMIVSREVSLKAVFSL